MPTRTASCSCGQLTIACEGEPVRISVCHCLACQRRSGSAFAFQARFPRAHTRATGTSTTYVRTGDSGTSAKFHFCPTCGATVFYEPEPRPEGDASDFVAVPGGAFANPSFPAPTVSVYGERRHAWVTVQGLVE